MNRAGIEWIETKEDEIARMITAIEHTDKLRGLGDILLQRNYISDIYHRDMCASLDYITDALYLGKRNTGILRNGGAR